MFYVAYNIYSSYHFLYRNINRSGESYEITGLRQSILDTSFCDYNLWPDVFLN